MICAATAGTSQSKTPTDFDKRKEKTRSSKNTNPNKKPLFMRILVLALCALMVIGLVASAVAGMAF